jgi:hypothetical protein
MKTLTVEINRHFESLVAWKKRREELRDQQFEKDCGTGWYPTEQELMDVGIFGARTEFLLADRHCKYHAKKISELVREQLGLGRAA